MVSKSVEEAVFGSLWHGQAFETCKPQDVMTSSFVSKALQQQSKLATSSKVRFNPTYTKMVLVVQGS